MEELKINSKETKDFFIHAFNEETLVPILGAGFTRGVNTGRVNPDNACPIRITAAAGTYTVFCFSSLM